MCVRERESVCERECVCVRESVCERECVKDSEYVCVRERVPLVEAEVAEGADVEGC